MMRVKKRMRIRWLSLFFLLVLPVAAYAGAPEVSHVMVTDVTTTSFSVIWASSEPSTASIEVYGVEDGTVPVPDAVITPHPIESGDDAIREAAEDNGVMKVRVTDLEPDTTYYFMTITTSKLTDDTTDYPVAAPFMSVTTESETVRTYESGGDILLFSNDLIIEACYLDNGTTFAEGTLLLATVAGGSHPVTSFVGDGVDSPYAIIDLNNMFSRDTFENLDLSQGLNITLLNFRGLEGNSIITYEVPEDQSLSEVKPAEFALKAGWNMVSFQLEPIVPDVETVLAPIMNKVSAIWGYDSSSKGWLSFDTSIPPEWNDLTECHVFIGYWLQMNDDASLMVRGSFSSNPILLHAGWNLVGSRSIQTEDIGDAIGPILNKLNAVWTYDVAENKWLSYDTSIPPEWNDLNCMEPGQGYWLDMNLSIDETVEWKPGQ
ncbi:MAG: fibronectin type III domain-containing protein [Deltaproteobacteria bacterium]|jgi:hypothetical protein|nr:fibronectin type III domain-containing protein [Deltaproteobacteria bacterium]